jgi:hypothetical protein
MQLPRTRQDVILEENRRRAQVSNPHIPPIDTTITTPIRRDTLGSPLSGGTLYDDNFDEPHEKQQNHAESKPELAVADSPSEEEDEWPAKYPVAPQYCRRWGKPESYVMLTIF